MRLPKLIPLYAIFLAIAFIPDAASDAGINQIVTEMVQSGKVHMRDKNYHKAYREFNRAWELASRVKRSEVVDHLEAACLALAEEYAAEKNWAQAIEYAKKAYEVKPYNEQTAELISDYYAQFGQSSHESKNLDTAKTYSQQAVDYNERNWNAYVTLGYAAYDMVKFDDAASYWKKAVSLNPDLPEIQELLGIHEKISGFEKNLQTFEMGNFKIEYELSAGKDYALKTARILQDAYVAIGAQEGYYPKAYVTAIIFFSPEYEKLMQEPLGRARPYDGIIRLCLDKAEDDAKLTERLSDAFRQSLLYRKGKSEQGAAF